MDRWRRRARALARPVEQTSFDWCALALAIWLAALVGTQLVVRVSQLPRAPETPAWHSMAGAVAAF